MNSCLVHMYTGGYMTNCGWAQLSGVGTTNHKQLSPLNEFPCHCDNPQWTNTGQKKFTEGFTTQVDQTEITVNPHSREILSINRQSHMAVLFSRNE